MSKTVMTTAVRVQLGLDFYHLLNIPPSATPGQVAQAYEDRLYQSAAAASAGTDAAYRVPIDVCLRALRGVA